LLYLLVTFQDCWASRHHGCWVHWWTFEIELHPLLRAADEVSEDVMRTGHYRSCCCQRSLPVEGLWTQVLLGLKVSCRYCSKHWKIAFPGFVFLAGFLGFGFSLFPPR
jgi:prepilin signal peptidase PulO-like enzyme (type II secretory pathway)